MSKVEDNMTSPKEYISQIKTTMQIIINNKGHRNEVARPPGHTNPPDTTGV